MEPRVDRAKMGIICTSAQVLESAVGRDWLVIGCVDGMECMVVG